jgi:hypothetical protein
MTRLSNTLAHLAEQIKETNAQMLQAQRTSAEAAIKAGGLLTEAKIESGHGAWLPFLDRAGISERTAQRFMSIWRSGLNPSLVSDLGGIKAALAFMSRWRMPAFNEALFIFDADRDAADEQSAGRGIAYIWEDEAHRGYYHVGMICKSSKPPQTLIDDESDDEAFITTRPLLPRIEIPGDRPVDVIIENLTRPDGFTLPISDWSMSFVDRRLPCQVLQPLFIERREMA